MGGESKSNNDRESYTIGDVGANARIQQGKNLTWTEAVSTLPDNTLKQQFEKLFEKILQDPTLNEDDRYLSIKKTEAIVKGLTNAPNSPKDLHHALIDGKNWFTNKASWVWSELSDVLRSDAAQKTIGTITESAVKGAIQAFIG